MIIMNLISQVLEKSVSMMESFQSVEEVNKQTKPNQTKSMIQDNNTGQYAGVSREANIKATLDDRVRKQR